MFECCKKPGYGDPTMPAPRYEDGRYLCEGDSIVHLMNVKACIHPDAFNIGQGGDITESPNMLGEVAAMAERHKTQPIEKVYIHTGGNYLVLWGSLDQNRVYTELDRLIKEYKKITKDITVSSLPYVYPGLTLKDRFPGIPKKIANIKCNDIFAIWSVGYEQVARVNNVKFFNEFLFLKTLYKKLGSEIWSDGIHHTLETQLKIGAIIRTYWGV